jgi:hypothetical protein
MSQLIQLILQPIMSLSQQPRLTFTTADLFKEDLSLMVGDIQLHQLLVLESQRTRLGTIKTLKPHTNLLTDLIHQLIMSLSQHLRTNYTT